MDRLRSRRSRQAHFLDGFGYPDGKFRFKPDWTKVPSRNNGAMGPWATHAGLPDHWEVIEAATDGASVPPCHEPGAQLPQFHLHRDADLARQGAAARGDDPSARRRALRASPTATG